MEQGHILSRSGVRLNGSAALVADQSVGIAIRYQGSQASATVTVVSATAITLKHGAAGSEAGDSTVGSSGAVAFATYTTLGAVVDAINLSPNWHAEIVDGLRADAVNSSQLLARSETTLSPARTQVLPLYWDTSAHLSLDYAISARRTNFDASQLGKTSVFQEARALCNIGSGALSVKVYSVPRNRASSTLLAEYAVADNTATTCNIGGGIGDLRSVKAGEDLLVRFVGTGDFPDSGAYLNVAGYVLP